MILIIPVKPHVKEFYQSSHVLGSEAISVRRNSRLGEMVAAVFCAYPLQDVDQEDLAPVDFLDPDRLHLQLTFPVRECLVTDDRLLQLGKLLEVIFEFYAIGWCKGRMDIYPSLNGAAERFSDKHQLSEEHYSPDAVRKLVGRATKAADTVYNKLSVRDKKNVASFAG
ncbi:hypothetical protein LX87_05198 [Larkinella arboricola]|uniref:Uncharacterized protein n=1 Tax=Larkinella arboricola TaxID=643671 RepID=A0A327WU06_LARAB|nr:hypothetical protein [Larkinella arboricola]RAJ92230.1 hypothetical protein LX87_05198 [Larkinella arboricola]